MAETTHAGKIGETNAPGKEASLPKTESRLEKKFSRYSVPTGHAVVERTENETKVVAKVETWLKDNGCLGAHGGGVAYLGGGKWIEGLSIAVLRKMSYPEVVARYIRTLGRPYLDSDLAMGMTDILKEGSEESKFRHELKTGKIGRWRYLGSISVKKDGSQLEVVAGSNREKEMDVLAHKLHRGLQIPLDFYTLDLRIADRKPVYSLIGNEEIRA